MKIQAVEWLLVILATLITQNTTIQDSTTTISTMINDNTMKKEGKMSIGGFTKVGERIAKLTFSIKREEKKVRKIRKIQMD